MFLAPVYPANFHCQDNNMDNGQNRKTEWDVHLSLETEINVINFFSQSPVIAR